MRRIFILFFLLAIVGLSGQTVVEWTTNLGNFKAELREDLVPITACNFRDLSNDGFYDGCIFHRVIADFMIQDGDPLGAGYGGPGYTIPDEFHPELTHERGVISMANTGNPNTGGSQYFITVVPTHWLDNAHAIFGHIIEGMDIVDDISVVPTDSSDRPIDPVIIDSIRVLTPPIDSFLPESTRNTVDMGHLEVFLMDADDYELVYEWYADDELLTETSSILTYTFEVDGYHEIKCVASGEYEYDYELVWQYEVINNEALEAEIEVAGFVSAYPNPFNPSTTISYNVQSASRVSISIYNLKGQLVEELVNSRHAAGSYEVNWESEGASGIYMLRYKNDDVVENEKLLLLK